MSSSLFDNCWYDYEPYPETDYIEGAKNFGELKEGDILYCLNKNYEVEELVITKPWHEAKGHCYISCGKKAINFGPSNCGNVSCDAKRNSVCYHDIGTLGTSRSVVLEKAKECLMERESSIMRDIEKFEAYKEDVSRKIAKIEILQFIKEN